MFELLLCLVANVIHQGSKKEVRSYRTPLILEPLLTQNKSFFVYIYKYISGGTQGDYAVKNRINKNEFRTWFMQKTQVVLSASEQEEYLLRLLEHHGISRLDWVMESEILIEKTIWKKYIEQISSEKPIQYILGYEYFAGQKFIVNADVLIPRPETEELVNWIVADNQNISSLNILEIGTGSACIAITLSKKIKSAHVCATDISDGALNTANKNATALHAEVQFIKDDILNSSLSRKDWDVIVSNPPYIPAEESNSIDNRVKNHEPNIALFTKEKQPMQFYAAIINFAKAHLKPSGHLYFEMHEDYAQQVAHEAAQRNMEWEIKKDFYGKERMICIKKGTL